VEAAATANPTLQLCSGFGNHCYKNV